MLKHGTWMIHSFLDPRWNKTGKGDVGMFMSYSDIPEAKKWIEDCQNKYGEIPEDCSWEYMKD